VTGAATPDPLVAAIGALSDWLATAGVPYAVIGGIAVSLQASPRFTEDLDAVIWTDDRTWPDLVDRAAAFGIEPRIDGVLEFAAQSRVILLRHSSGVPIDVSCGTLPFEEDLVTSASTIEVGGVRLRVARPEDLLVTKAIANRPRDRADIEALLAAHPDLDVSRARRVVVEFAAALEQPELVDEFDRATRRAQR
jgi:hypothetical protein